MRNGSIVARGIGVLGLLALAAPALAAAPGDVNLDGAVGDADALLLERHLDGRIVLDCAERLAADVVPDGVLDQTDLDVLADPVQRAQLVPPAPPRTVPPIATPGASSRDVRLLSFNIRLADVDPWPNRWVDRRSLLFEAVAASGADVIGLQEAEYQNGTFRTEEILAQFPEYDLVELTHPGAYFERLLYRTARLSVESQGLWVIEPDPAQPDAQECRWIIFEQPVVVHRYITWARFVDRQSSDAFYVYNVHLCPNLGNLNGAFSRQVHVGALTSQIWSRAHPEDPVVALGDFNENEGDPVVRFMKGEAGLFGSEDLPNPVPMVDSFRVFDPTTPYRGTTNSYTQNPSHNHHVTTRKLDYVFTSEGLEVCEADIDHRWQEVPDGASVKYTYPSDHYAVTALVQLHGKDGDSDGVVDPHDNCPGAANPLAQDADVDGAGDPCDNCILRANASLIPDSGGHAQLDADLDGYGNACDGDLNQDQVADGSDWAIVAACFGEVSGTPGGPPDDALCSESDLTGDTVVGGPDFQLLASMLGDAPGPSGLECAGTSPCAGP
jgi:endonuclease/exonuclease/phosphatase family metal-dependent hydrolase